MPITRERAIQILRDRQAQNDPDLQGVDLESLTQGSQGSQGLGGLSKPSSGLSVAAGGSQAIADAFRITAGLQPQAKADSGGGLTQDLLKTILQQKVKQQFPTTTETESQKALREAQTEQIKTGGVRIPTGAASLIESLVGITEDPKGTRKGGLFGFGPGSSRDLSTGQQGQVDLINQLLDRVRGQGGTIGGSEIGGDLEQMTDGELFNIANSDDERAAEAFAKLQERGAV